MKKDKVQAGLAKGAVRAAMDGLPVFSISCDVQGSTGISAFQKALPERFVEVGIAEANMVSVGAGYAKSGYIPIVDTFGQFGVTKGNLPLTMAALSQAPVIAMFSHIGFQDAADGASHQATTYIAAVSSIPHTCVIMPSCPDEAESLMYQAIQRYAADRAAARRRPLLRGPRELPDELDSRRIRQSPSPRASDVVLIIAACCSTSHCRREAAEQGRFSPSSITLGNHVNRDHWAACGLGGRGPRRP